MDDASRGSLVERHDDELDVVLSSMSMALLPGMAMMIIRKGPDAGTHIVLEREMTGAGSHPDSDIYIDDPAVSSRHAEIYRDGESFKIDVTDNSHRIYVNGNSVRSQELQHGDEVQIGKVNLVFVAGSNSEPAALATASTSAPRSSPHTGSAMRS